METIIIGLYCLVGLMGTLCSGGKIKVNDFKNIINVDAKENIDNSVENHNYKVIEPAPCQIVNTQFGCCWDQKTIAMGPNGKGCPYCKDHRHMKCKNWKPFCKGRVVSEMCPMTCGKCPKKQCEDDKSWEKYCPLYNSLGFCKQITIARHCKSTCQKCT